MIEDFNTRLGSSSITKLTGYSINVPRFVLLKPVQKEFANQLDGFVAAFCDSEGLTEGLA